MFPDSTLSSEAQTPAAEVHQAEKGTQSSFERALKQLPEAVGRAATRADVKHDFPFVAHKLMLAQGYLYF